MDPIASTSPNGRAAAGAMSSMRGSGRIAGTDWARLWGMSDPDSQQGCYTQSIQPAATSSKTMPSLGKALKLARGKGLGDIEEPEEDERDQGVSPVRRAEEQRDPLPGNFVDDDELRVVPARFSGSDGCGGHAEDERQSNADEQRNQQRLWRWMNGPRVAGPEQHCGHRAPCAGRGLAEARAEEGGNRPCQRVFGCVGTGLVCGVMLGFFVA